MNIELLEKYLLWITIYSVIGWLYETTFCSIQEKKFVNRGFLNGPYCPIYGWGAILDIIILGRIDNPFLLFILGMLLTCTLEYLTSYLMEKLFHARWWDYSQVKFNINGRVCLLGAVVFGAFSVVLIKLIHPFITHYTDMLPSIALHIITAVLAAVFITDNLITFIGFSDFNSRLKEFTALFEAKREEASRLIDGYKSEAVEKLRETRVYSEVSEAYESFNRKLGFQQRRMLNAFPRLRSVKYNGVLDELRKHFEKLKADRKKK